MGDSRFYDAGPLKQIATNLFYGWGYNFYRHENQLRADDQLIRAKAGWLLGLAHASVETAESDFRRDNLPPPSRAQPFPDPTAVADAQNLERLGKSIDMLIGRLHSLPTPENDRMTQRYRNEIETLRALGECDARLVGQCELLRDLVDHKRGAWIIDNLALIVEGVGAITTTVQDRQRLLT